MRKKQSTFKGYPVFILLFSCLFLFTSCVTKISDMGIRDIEVVIKDSENRITESLLPDQTYNLDFTVTDIQGNIVENANYRDLVFSDIRNMELTTKAFFSIRFHTNLQTFHPPGSDAFGFTLTVKDNSFNPLRLTYPLDWEHYSVLDFSGKSGISGEDGTRGASASGESADTVFGGIGENGTDGIRGKSGKDIKLAAARYNFGSEIKYIFYEPDLDLIFITDVKKITIDTSGGDGGDGGSGGNGGAGSDYLDSSTGDVLTEAVPGIPGDGGRGANGGNGGNITILSSDPKIMADLILNADGGDSGKGGAPGKSYDSSTETFSRGERGRDGRKGSSGRTEKIIIPENELLSIFMNIHEKGFDYTMLNF